LSIYLFVEGAVASSLSDFLLVAVGTSLTANLAGYLTLGQVLKFSILSSPPSYRQLMTGNLTNLVFAVIGLVCAAKAYSSFPMDLKACTASLVHRETFTENVNNSDIFYSYENYGSEAYFQQSSKCASQQSSVSDMCNCVTAAATHCYTYLYWDGDNCDEYLYSIPSFAEATYNLAVFHLIAIVLITLMFVKYFSVDELPKPLFTIGVLMWLIFDCRRCNKRKKSKPNQGFVYDKVAHQTPNHNPLQDGNVEVDIVDDNEL
jgi:hypothetical protein